MTQNTQQTQRTESRHQQADYNCFMDYAAGFVATDEELEMFEEESGNSQQELFNHTKRNAWHDDDEPNELRVGGFVDSSDED